MNDLNNNNRDYDAARRYHADAVETLSNTFKPNNALLKFQPFDVRMVLGKTLRFDLYNLQQFSSLSLLSVFLYKPYKIQIEHDVLPKHSRQVVEFCSTSNIAHVIITWQSSRILVWRDRLVSIMNIMGLMVLTVFILAVLIQIVFSKNIATGGSASPVDLFRDTSKLLFYAARWLFRCAIQVPLFLFKLAAQYANEVDQQK